MRSQCMKPPEKPPHPKPRVLIVEDEGLVAADLSRVLRNGGCDTFLADSGEAAFASLRLDHPDVVLMDIRLKGLIDGIDIALEILRTSRLPVVFLSAHTDPETMARVETAGAWGFIPKPYNPAHVAKGVRDALAKPVVD
jgi:CheY-like chemotaxis protein